MSLLILQEIQRAPNFQYFDKPATAAMKSQTVLSALPEVFPCWTTEHLVGGGHQTDVTTPAARGNHIIPATGPTTVKILNG